jgi:hypothetical protein
MEPTRLGAALAAKDVPATTAGNAFSASLAGARVCDRFELKLGNGIVVTCAITLLGGEALLVVESEVRRRMAEMGIPNDVSTQGDYEFLRARHILERAVREWDPVKGASAPPLGTHEQWGDVIPESIRAAYARYNELREMHDPLGDDVLLSKVELDEIEAAIQKKNRDLLRYFGLQRVTAYLLTLGAPPAISPIPTSPPGDSLQES